MTGYSWHHNAQEGRVKQVHAELKSNSDALTQELSTEQTQLRAASAAEDLGAYTNVKGHGRVAKSFLAEADLIGSAQNNGVSPIVISALAQRSLLYLPPRELNTPLAERQRSVILELHARLITLQAEVRKRNQRINIASATIRSIEGTRVMGLVPEQFLLYGNLIIALLVVFLCGICVHALLVHQQPSTAAIETSSAPLTPVLVFDNTKTAESTIGKSAFSPAELARHRQNALDARRTSQIIKW